MRPVIGITCDRDIRGDRTYHLSRAEYARAVVAAGGTPVLLAQETDAIGGYLQLCNGFLLTGGSDADTRLFGQPLHPQAKLIEPARQVFDMELLNRLDGTQHPVLAICLSMQLMSLHHGGRLHQHLPDVLPPEAAAHHIEGNHPVTRTADCPSLPAGGVVHSHHHQSVADPGSLRICAVCEEDGVIEAVDLPGKRLYLGVQWHPERTSDQATGLEIVKQLVSACQR